MRERWRKPLHAQSPKACRRQRRTPGDLAAPHAVARQDAVAQPAREGTLAPSASEQPQAWHEAEHLMMRTGFAREGAPLVLPRSARSTKRLAQTGFGPRGAPSRMTQHAEGEPGTDPPSVHDTGEDVPRARRGGCQPGFKSPEDALPKKSPGPAGRPKPTTNWPPRGRRLLLRSSAYKSPVGRHTHWWAHPRRWTEATKYAKHTPEATLRRAGLPTDTPKIPQRYSSTLPGAMFE